MKTISKMLILSIIPISLASCQTNLKREDSTKTPITSKDFTVDNLGINQLGNATVVKDSQVRINQKKLSYSIYPNEIWGNDNNSPTDIGLELNLSVNGEKYYLSHEILYGIVSISKVSYMSSQNSITLYLTGGDAAGSYRAAVKINNDHIFMYIEHGEMGEMICEYREYMNGNLKLRNTHNSYLEN
jgi:hypothetical protein